MAIQEAPYYISAGNVNQFRTIYSKIAQNPDILDTAGSIFGKKLEESQKSGDKEGEKKAGANLAILGTISDFAKRIAPQEKNIFVSEAVNGFQSGEPDTDKNNEFSNSEIFQYLNSLGVKHGMSAGTDTRRQNMYDVNAYTGLYKDKRFNTSG